MSQAQTLEMVKCVRLLELAAMPDLLINLTIKPHPACNLECDLSEFPMYRLVDSDIQELLLETDFVFSGNSTTAGLEAYLAGLKTAIYLDKYSLNLSPLKGVKGVKFVSNSAELLSFILEGDGDCVNSASADSFFCIDESKSSWYEVFMDEFNLGRP
jgi:surface carbohydrate biosynthesis protein (TIGR04326 family)